MMNFIPSGSTHTGINTKSKSWLILQREEHKRQFLMIFQEEMHLKYCENVSLVIFSHYKRSPLYSFITILWRKQSGLCLGGSKVTEKSLKNYLVLRGTEKLLGILQSRGWKYISSAKNQKYCKVWEKKEKSTLKRLFSY